MIDDISPEDSPKVNLPVKIVARLRGKIEMHEPMAPRAQAMMRLLLRPIFISMPPETAPMVIPRTPDDPISD